MIGTVQILHDLLEEAHPLIGLCLLVVQIVNPERAGGMRSFVFAVLLQGAYQHTTFGRHSTTEMRTGRCSVSWSTCTNALATPGSVSSLSCNAWLTSCDFHKGVSASMTISTSTK